MKHYLAMTGLLASSLIGMQAHAAEREGAAQDAWIDGTLETVYGLNRHLRAFAIDTEVDKGVVHLTGNVSHDIDRDLAEELAKNIDGVVEVDNDLVVATDTRQAARDADGEDSRRSFGTWIDDATTTAAVKTRLIGNSNTSGLQIDVDTRGDEVTLSGEVPSAQEKSLAEEIALSTGDVQSVRNQLVVRAAR
jgi:osmotically-inducible protein OsmY